MFEGGSDRTEDHVPRLAQVRVQRLQRRRPKASSPSRFLVSVHIEASVITWQTEVSVEPDVEQTLLSTVSELHGWSLGLDLLPDIARDRVAEIGATLRDVFLGEALDVIARLRPTGLLLEIDESMLGLPWELLLDEHDQPFSLHMPVGRIVTTNDRPEPSRDPLDDDADLTFLVVVPDSELAATTQELAAIESLPDRVGSVTLTVESLTGSAATKRGVARALADRSVEILHFAGHGAGADDAGVRLSDGWLRPQHIADFAWKVPPYLVFASACESARVTPGSRLLSSDRSGGLPSAFLARGVEAFAGHYWPVGDGSAAQIAEVFYETLFRVRNVGVALQTARQALAPSFHDDADLGALGTVFFGDVGTAHRADLAEAV